MRHFTSVSNQKGISPQDCIIFKCIGNKDSTNYQNKNFQGRAED